MDMGLSRKKAIKCANMMDRVIAKHQAVRALDIIKNKKSTNIDLRKNSVLWMPSKINSEFERYLTDQV